jgi:preprotein translocase subunit SecA
LSGKKVHIATVNDYLAHRDCKWMYPVYEFMGLNVDCVLSFMTDPERRQAYKADVVYGNNYEFGFDYLRDNAKNSLEDRVQSKLEYVIIDEIDSILMDEATTPLVVSGVHEDDKTDNCNDLWKFRATVESLLEMQNQLVEQLFYQAQEKTDNRFFKLIQITMADPWNKNLLDYLSQNKDAHKKMRAVWSKFSTARSEYKLEEDLFYVVDERHHTLRLTDNGISMVEKQLGQGFMTLNSEADSSGDMRDFLQILRAYVLHRKDEDYIVHDSRIIIVDEFTGRLAFGKKYEEGLHQAIECKEGLRITSENYISGRITHPNYFRLYDKMTGMTATAHTEAEEFKNLYKLEVVRIPTNKPLIRADLPDCFYRTEEEKLDAIIQEIKEYHGFGRPILVGTRSVEKSERLSELLTQSGIKHSVLNAKNHAQEAEIIKSAGQPYAVTIATNMAGRGTDIALGKDLYQVIADNYIKYFKETTGNIQINIYSQLEFEILQERFSKMDPELQKRISLVFIPDPLIPNSQLSTLNFLHFGLGLHMIGTERHGARRIDDQLKGRSGRQGDPGSSRFYLSSQDDLFRIFGREEMETLLKASENSQIQKLKRLTRKAQRESEEMSYQIRKYVLERDDVADKQRKVIYRMRHETLSGEWDKDDVESLIEDCVSDIINCGRYVNPEKIAEEWDISGLENYCMLNFGVHLPDLSVESLELRVERKNPYIPNSFIEEVRELMVKAFKTSYEKREKILGGDFSRKLCKAAMISALETAWIDYLYFQSEFDRSLALRSYVKGNILLDYKKESAELFNDLLASIRSEAMKGIFTYPLPGENLNTLRWTEKADKLSKEIEETLLFG